MLVSQSYTRVVMGTETERCHYRNRYSRFYGKVSHYRNDDSLFLPLAVMVLVATLQASTEAWGIPLGDMGNHGIKWRSRSNFTPHIVPVYLFECFASKRRKRCSSYMHIIKEMK